MARFSWVGGALAAGVLMLVGGGAYALASSWSATITSIGSIPIYSSPGGDSTSRTPGYALADTSSAGGTYPSGYPTGDVVTVETFAASSDAPANTAFSVAVFC